MTVRVLIVFVIAVFSVLSAQTLAADRDARFFDTELTKSLGLDEVTAARVSAILAEKSKAERAVIDRLRAGAARNKGVVADSTRAELQRIEANAATKLSSVLSPEQMRKYRRMRGGAS